MSSPTNSLSGASIERLGVEPLAPRPARNQPRPVPDPPVLPAPQIVHVPDPEPVFRAIARVLAVRLQLLLSLIGAFALATLAMSWQSPIGLAILAAFAGLTVLPLVLLEYIGKRG